MKKTLLLLLFSIMAYAQPQVSTPPDLVICDDDNDGIATFDLTSLDALILGGLNPSEYSISYHETLADATAGTNAINFPQSYSNVFALTTNGSQTLYVRVEEIATPTIHSIQSFHIIVNPAPVINTPVAYIVCEEDLSNDGFAIFNLTSKNDEILGANAGLGFTVQYYASLATLQAGLALPAIYTNTTPATQTLYVKVTSIDGCTATTTLTLKVNPLPEVPMEVTLFSCDGNYDLTNAIETTGYIVSFYTTEADAWAQANQIAQPASYAGTGTVYARVSLSGNEPGSPDCAVVTRVVLTTSQTPQLSINGQAATIILQPGATYLFSIDNGPQQESNVFENLAYGAHIVTVQIAECGTFYSIQFMILPAPPTGAPTQAYVEGSTLADLDVDGQNIQWYADADAATALAATTVVTDGTTYYATQTIDTYQSPAFGVLVSRAAGTDGAVFSGFTYYPNPAQNVLTLHNSSEITKVEAYNLLGQLALSQNTLGTKADINVQPLQPGVYIVKAYSGNNIKTIRIIKAE